MVFGSIIVYVFIVYNNCYIIYKVFIILGKVKFFVLEVCLLVCNDY